MFVEKEMLKMMKYEDPKLNVICFDIADILTTSDGNYVELPGDPIGGGRTGEAE